VIHFSAVATKPGKPITFATSADKVVFGLPGNPISCMVCFQLYVRPALDKMTGKAPPGMKRGKAIMDIDFKVRPGRRKFLRAKVAGQGPELRVRPYQNQKSGVLRSMLDADVLVDVPGETEILKAGTVVDVWWLREDWNGQTDSR